MKIKVKIKNSGDRIGQSSVLHDFWNVLLRLLCSFALTFGLLIIFFFIASNTGSVAVEITDIPNNWLVRTLVEREDDNSTVGSGLRGRVSHGEVAVTMDQKGMLFGTRNNDGGMIKYEGTFVTEDGSFSDAYILIEPENLATISLSGLEVYITKPVIKFLPVIADNQAAEVDIHTGVTGDSVEQHIKVDFDSYIFEFLATGLNEASYHGSSILSGDLTFTAYSDIAIYFENCSASIVVDDKATPISECVYHFEDDADTIVLGSLEQTQEGFTYYKVEIPRHSTFSLSSSSFSYMDLWGIGKCIFNILLKMSNTICMIKK